MARRKAGLGAINKGKLVKVCKYMTILCQETVIGFQKLFSLYHMLCPQEKFAAKGSEIADLQLSHVSSG